jgi:hypothetical protein
LLEVDKVAVDGASETAFADLACWALTVEFDEEVDDSRTGGRAFRVMSLVLAPVMLEIGRGRSGLLVLYFASLTADVTRPPEYDDAELGVGTWLYGESVYLDEGVPECESPGTGGVVSLIEYVFCVSKCRGLLVGAAELRYSFRYSYLPVGGSAIPSTASSSASL